MPERDPLEGLAIDGPRRTNASLESHDFAVPHQKRSIHIPMTKIQADRSARCISQKPAIPDRSGVIGIELKGDCSWIVLADIECQVLHVVMKPIRGTKTSTPHHALGLGRICKCSIFQAKDSSLHTLAAQKVLAPSILSNGIRLGPKQRLRD